MAQDYTGIPEDLKAKLLKWEANTPANKQVAILSDIADISQEMLNAMDSERKGNNKAIEHFGSLLVDMREQLTSLNAKETPETPDTSKPVIDAISKLERALTGSIKAIDTKPTVNVPQARAPVVNVDAPVVRIDNAEIAKILKTDLPKAFNEAIKSIVIPKNDTSELAQLLSDASEKLTSIDTAVRMQPQAPTTVGISGDVTTIDLTYATRIDDSATPIIYIGKAPINSITSAATWQIAKLDTSSGLSKTWAGSAGFTQIWDNRAGLTYN